MLLPILIKWYWWWKDCKDVFFMGPAVIALGIGIGGAPFSFFSLGQLSIQIKC